MPRIATYTRISTDETNQPYSLGAQGERLGAYISSQEDWEHVASYSDQASGAKRERPGLQQALRDASLGRYDVLLVYRVDRLCRSVGLLAELLAQLDHVGVGFRSATEPFETTTPSGRMMMQMLGVFAEFERASIIERVVMGMGRKAAQGRWVGGTQPLGYRRAPDGGGLVIDEAEATVVRLMFDLYVNDLAGSHEIAARLNESGHRTKAGRPFSFKSVLTILKNRMYVGEIGWRGEYYEGEHEAIVDPVVFGHAQALLAERGADPAKRAAHASDYLLTGLVVCSCGTHCVGTAATGRSRTYRYYTCNSRQRYGRDTCGAARLRADDLDAAIIARLVDLLADSDLIEEAVARAKEQGTARAELNSAERCAVETELAEIEAAIERYLASFERGTMPEELCGPRVRALNERAGRLQERLAELVTQRENATLTAPEPDVLAAVRQELVEAVARGSRRHLKALIAALVHEVRVEGPNAVRPVFKIPDGAAAITPETVREPSRLVEVSGLEPPTSTLRT